MDLNVPITLEQHSEADESYAVTVENQRLAANEIADKLSANAPLSRCEQEFAAAILKGWARSLSTIRPRPSGKPQQLPGELAQEFAALVVFEDKTQNRAIELLAENYSSSETAIKKHLGLTGKTPKQLQRKTETNWFIQSMRESEKAKSSD